MLKLREASDKPFPTSDEASRMLELNGAKRKIPMETVDLRDLPEPIARAVEAMVETIRQQLAKGTPVQPPAREFPRWPGTVLGTLSREEIYDDRA